MIAASALFFKLILLDIFGTQDNAIEDLARPPPLGAGSSIEPPPVISAEPAVVCTEPAFVGGADEIDGGTRRQPSVLGGSPGAGWRSAMVAAARTAAARRRC
jgi:hypothetical protein